MRDINEADWKILRKLHSDALERFCERILLEVEQIHSDSTKSFHQRYLDIYAAMRKRDKEIALVFNDLRRSTALAQLAGMKSRDLLIEDEFSRFSLCRRDRRDVPACSGSRGRIA